MDFLYRRLFVPFVPCSFTIKQTIDAAKDHVIVLEITLLWFLTVACYCISITGYPVVLAYDWFGYTLHHVQIILSNCSSIFGHLWPLLTCYVRW